MRQRLLSGLILAAAALLAAWWILHVPYRPDRVFAAIPADATLVSVQERLASHWDEFFKTPLPADLLKASGVQNVEWAALSTNAVIKTWAEKLASDRSVVAFVPAMGRQHKPALAFASWIGSESRILRWQTAWMKSRDFRPMTLDEGGLTLFRVRTDLDKSGLHLSLALSEGLVLGCLSSDPIAVSTLLETAEERPGRASLATSGKPARVRELLKTTPPQWGWLDLHDTLLAYRLGLNDKRLSLFMTGLRTFPPARDLTALPGLKLPQALTANKTDFIAVLPLNWLHTLLPADSSLAWMQAVRDATDSLNAPPDALAFVAVLDQAHHGRLRGPLGSTLRAFVKGVKTPTLVIGLQLGSQTEAESRIRALLSTLNSHYAMTLSTRQDDGFNMLTVIEESGKSGYGSFESGERVAYTMADDWLILGSHASVLKTLLGEPQSRTFSLLPVASIAPAALAHANLDGLGQTIRNMAGVLKLATAFNGSTDMAQTREQLNRMSTGAEIIRVFSEANASLCVSGQVFEATLTLEKKP